MEETLVLIKPDGVKRGDYALTMDSNVVHASDSVDSAAREIHLWFPEYK